MIPKNYIEFLKGYKKLLERGIKNIFLKTIAPNFIWISDVQRMIDADACTSNLPNLFSDEEISNSSSLAIFKKPNKPTITIPSEFIESIIFDEAKNSFKNVDDDIDALSKFKETEFYKWTNEDLDRFKKNKKVYSTLFRAYNDIKIDSNVEVVLSVGLIQYSDKINQHLFHFPLSIDLQNNGDIKLSFSGNNPPYFDTFFLNSVNGIEKSEVGNITDRFEAEINEKGYQCIYDESFRSLIQQIANISEDLEFDKSLNVLPNSNAINKVSYAPSINVKRKKPRFFIKLTENIIENVEQNELELSLFNRLIQNSEATPNTWTKPNYFIDEWYKPNKESLGNLEEQDFTSFFPLAFNKEQKKIYENYQKNKLSVVTGPPGTGKSHTIVNILCCLLAQGKRVLVTAQTNKALESLLSKIPTNFDDLVFTKIQLENDKERFSLNKSIDGIRSILTKNYSTDISDNLKELNKLKGEYAQLKYKVKEVLENEYKTIPFGGSELRYYEVWDRISRKDEKEHDWIKDDVTDEILNDIENALSVLAKYQNYYGNKNQTLANLQFQDTNIKDANKAIQNFDIQPFIEVEGKPDQVKQKYFLNDEQLEKLREIDFDKLRSDIDEYSNGDIIVNNERQLNEIDELVEIDNTDEFYSNRSYSELTEQGEQIKLDIQTYMSLIPQGKETLPLTKKLLNSTYPKVKYLEGIALNSNKCDNKSQFFKLLKYINLLTSIESEYKHLVGLGFRITREEDATLSKQISLLQRNRKQVEKNRNALLFLNNNEGLKTINIKTFDIDEIKQTINLVENHASDIQRFYELKKELEIVSNKIRPVKRRFAKYYPLQENSNLYGEFKAEWDEFYTKTKKARKFKKAKEYLQEKLPQTLNTLHKVDSEYFTKENFEYKKAKQTLLKTEYEALQSTKNKINDINNAIYKIKCEILYSSARDKFKNSFKEHQVNDFINTLSRYENDSTLANRGIRDRVIFQILARKGSSEISKKLSCWVMSFNDVLNALDAEHEIFDCIIVDEASQLNFTSLLLGYFAKNMIVVGDDKQTSPSNLTGVDGDDFESLKQQHLGYMGKGLARIRSDASLFTLSKMVAGKSDLMLVEHFRCVPEIIEFSKHHFYNNQLRPLKQINSERLKPLEVIYVENGVVENKYVKAEIDAIKAKVLQLLNNPKYADKTIGVVSLGLANHTEKIKTIIEDFEKSIIEKHNLTIDDASNFQGDERDIMIVSLGVALDIEGKLPRAIINSLDEKKKINVALSRAKEQMILFHSIKLEQLSEKDFRRKIISFFHAEYTPIKPLYLPDDVDERSLYNRPEPFDSWFEYDIAKELINRGFVHIKPQYKVKDDEFWENPKTGKKTKVNFKLDLVVFRNNKQVAIECDGDPFHTSPDDVAYDVERQEFLERVGWKVHRILYSSYKRNPNDELEKLVKFIERNTMEDTVITTNDEIDDSQDVNVTESFSTETNLEPRKHRSYIDDLEEQIIDNSIPFSKKENEL